jgi:hypothetical protein
MIDEDKKREIKGPIIERDTAGNGKAGASKLFWCYSQIYLRRKEAPVIR